MVYSWLARVIILSSRLTLMERTNRLIAAVWCAHVLDARVDLLFGGSATLDGFGLRFASLLSAMDAVDPALRFQLALVAIGRFCSHIWGGVDLGHDTVRELLGPGNYAMTLRYAHLAPKHRLKAVEIVDRRTELSAAVRAAAAVNRARRRSACCWPSRGWQSRRPAYRRCS